MESEPCLQPTPQLWQCWILNPLSKVRDQTLVLMDKSKICYSLATMGTPLNFFHNFLGGPHSQYMLSYQVSDQIQDAAVAMLYPKPIALGQGSNPCLSSDLNCHRDNARSFIHCTTVGTSLFYSFLVHGSFISFIKFIS